MDIDLKYAELEHNVKEPSGLPLLKRFEQRHRMLYSLCFFSKLVSQLLESGQYSDFTIICGDREFRVHQAIVCPQSKIFERACTGQFVEASTKTMTLVQEDPAIISLMIDYLYSHSYKDKDDEDDDWDFSDTLRPQDDEKKDEPPRVPTCLKLYAVADKYMIQGLKSAARDRFAAWAIENWSNPSFLLAVREIYENETGNYVELRNAAVRPMVARADDMFMKEEFVNLLKDFGELSTELLRRVLDKNRIAKRGLEFDIAELTSRIEALKLENRKVHILQHENHKLSKELLEVKMTALVKKCQSGQAASSTREGR
ncbi:hypothetical protein VTN00DRAFT_2644 [Thermoascus crustaceus]|uniref:uncharacterized protein n=1 Tax=Thermoascus crustaceus TaxID=5088 RepID=UPI00374432B5